MSVLNKDSQPTQRRLGRGLEALLGQPAAKENAPLEEPVAGVAAAAAPANQVVGGAAPAARALQVPIAQLDPNPFQPRREFDDAELATLCQSLKDHGMLQPLVVRLVGGRYQVIAGERRLRAAQKAGWNAVPVRLIEVADRQVAEVAIVENLQRTDLNPLEKAAAFQKYLADYKCPQDELAKRIGIDRSTIANFIRLLELPAVVQDAVRKNQVSAGHARALLPLGDEKEQAKFCHRIQAEGLSVRSTEQMVKELIAKQDADPAAAGDAAAEPAPAPRSEHLASLEQELRTFFGTKVDLKSGANQKGRIVIHFNNGEEFERVRSLLSVPGVPGKKAG